MSQPINIPSTGEHWLDMCIRDALNAKGRHGYKIAEVRARALRNVAKAAKNQLEVRDRRIAELEDENARLVKLAGGAGAVQLQESLAAAEKEVEQLNQYVDDLLDNRAAFDDLAQAVLNFLGPEAWNESLDHYRLRRLAEEAPRED